MYKHLRTNRIYCLLMRASDKTTGEEVVVFQSVKTGRVWIRPSREFFDGRYEDLSAGSAPQAATSAAKSNVPASSPELDDVGNGMFGGAFLRTR